MLKSIVISGYYGYGNTGDEAVLAGMLATFREVDLDARVTVLSADPARTMGQHAGVKSVHRYRILDLIRVIRGADLVISGGGSLFQDVTSARSVRYYLFILQMAQFFRRKTMIYAQGVGPLNTIAMRKAVKKTLNKVNMITVRDAESKRLLQEIGVKRPQIHLSADPALVLNADITESQRIISEQGVSGAEMIGVSLRPWPGYENQIAEAVEGIDEACRELGVKPALIPMQESEDCGVCEAIFGGIMLKGGGMPEVVKGLISKCGLIVGMRLHAFILAASESVPFLPISYDPKVSAFVSAIGCDSQIDISAVTSQEVKNAVIQAWNERAARSQSISQRASELRILALNSGELAKALII